MSDLLGSSIGDKGPVQIPLLSEAVEKQLVSHKTEPGFQVMKSDKGSAVMNTSFNRESIQISHNSFSNQRVCDTNVLSGNVQRQHVRIDNEASSSTMTSCDSQNSIQMLSASHMEETMGNKLSCDFGSKALTSEVISHKFSNEEKTIGFSKSAPEMIANDEQYFRQRVKRNTPVSSRGHTGSIILQQKRQITSSSSSNCSVGGVATHHTSRSGQHVKFFLSSTTPLSPIR